MRCRCRRGTQLRLPKLYCFVGRGRAILLHSIYQHLTGIRHEICHLLPILFAKSCSREEDGSGLATNRLLYSKINNFLGCIDGRKPYEKILKSSNTNSTLFLLNWKTVLFKFVYNPAVDGTQYARLSNLVNNITICGSSVSSAEAVVTGFAFGISHKQHALKSRQGYCVIL